MHRMNRRALAPGLLTSALAMAALGAPSAVAQDQTPAPAGPTEDPPVAALHRGDCAEPQAEPEVDLGLLAPRDALDPLLAYRGQETEASPILVGEATVDMPFDDVFAATASYALTIHESAATFGTMLACGEVGGHEVDGRVVIGLRPVDGSKHAGIAILDDDDAGFLGLGQNQTRFSLYLLSDSTGAPAEAEPAAETTPDQADAQPATDEPAADEATGDATEGVAALDPVTVEVVDIDFDPGQFTIPANADVPVTLTNSGAIQHTFTIDELEIDEVLDPGETREITINAEPGQYTFYCAVPGHREAGQEGTMTVE